MSERRPIRVLVADDSLTMRSYLGQMIAAAPGLEVAGEARDGAEAITMTEALLPDVISMDIRMPTLDGLAAIRQIMARRPTPTVVVSSLVESEVDLSFQALEAGALAVLPKPPARQDASFAQWQRQYINALSAMAQVSVVRRWENHSAFEVSTAPVERPLKPYKADAAIDVKGARPEVVAIGASAGGPTALSELLRHLLPDYPAPIVIVQHLPDEFIDGLARWLATVTLLPVCVASDRQVLQAGTVYVAPGGGHLKIARLGNRLITTLSEDPIHQRYCPSIDVLLTSVAEVCGTTGVGIVLTGMGEDGAVGLKRLREAGGRTVAQSEASCTVFGMPGAAIARGAVQQILSPAEMAMMLQRLRALPAHGSPMVSGTG